jgi:hypothetical protein
MYQVFLKKIQLTIVGSYFEKHLKRSPPRGLRLHSVHPAMTGMDGQSVDQQN